MSAEESYKTSDIHLAAALLSSGHIFCGTQPEKGRGSRAIFCFEEAEQLDQDVMDYMNDKLLCSPRDLFGRLRELKGLAANLYL